MARYTYSDELYAELVGSTWGREPGVMRALGRGTLRPMTTDAPADTLSPARNAMVQFALSTVGWTKPDPRLGKLVAPGDTVAQELAIEDESLCMLVVLGLQDNVFQLPPRGPYVNGSAPTLLERRAQGSPSAPGGAMRHPTDAEPPVPGDALWYGPSAAEPFEHTETVTDAVALDAQHLKLTCVAGGQRTSAGLETIKLMYRTLVWVGTHWVDQGTQRPVIGVVDCDLMLGLYGLRAA